MLPEVAVDTSTNPEAELSETLYRHYNQAQSEWETRGRISKDFVHNVQFTEEQIKALQQRGQAAVAINVVWPAMEQAVAMLTANNPAFQATAKEDSDVGTAKAISDMYQHDWYHSDGTAELKTSLYDYFQTGRGVLRAYVDPNANLGRGAVRYRSEDGLMVYPDPNSRDKLWRDAAHIICRNVMTGEQILAVWPDAKELLASARTSHDDPSEWASNRQGEAGYTRGRIFDQHHTRYRVLERFSRIKVTYAHIAEMDTGEEKVLLPEQFEEYLQSPAVVMQLPDGNVQYFVGDNAEQGLSLLEQSEQTADGFLLPVGEGMPPAILTPVTHADLVEEGRIAVRRVMLPRIKQVITIGGQLYYTGFLPTSHYPIVPINGRWDRNPYPMSDVEFVTPLQESINKLHMQLVANLANSTNVKALVPRGSIDRQQVQLEFAKAGAAIIEYDAEFGAPHIVAPLPPPTGLFNHIAQLRQMVEVELGIFSMQAGDASNAPPTYKGTLALDEYGQRRIKSKQDDIEAALNQLGKAGLDLMQHVYTEQMIFRITEPNNREREQVINYTEHGKSGRINDLTLGQYDVMVVSGSTLPSNRYALLEYYMQLYQMGIIDQEEVLKKTDVADADGVLRRIGQIQQMQQQMQAMDEEIKRLRGDLQTSQRESSHARDRVALSKTQTTLGRIEADAQAATQLYKARLNDQLSLTKNGSDSS